MKAAICIAAAAIASLIHVVAAADYVVGSPTGAWGGGTDYKSWAAAQTFAPGDTITFNYNSYHNVVEVTKDDYEACSTASPVAYYTSGSTTIALTAPGKRYFICGAPGHCQAGMKMEVDVADRPAPTTPSPPPQLPQPRQEKRRRHAPAPMPLPPAPSPLSPAAPAPAAEPPKHAGHKKKHKKRHSPPATAPTVQSVEAYFPMAALAPMSSPPPPPPTSSGAAAMLRAEWGVGTAGLVAIGLVVLAL